ncbi:MAG: TetR/AcrR family transcriptional regulator [Halieaceae bacterium]
MLNIRQAQLARGCGASQNSQMAKNAKRARVTKDQWLTKALDLFTREGEPGIRIEQLARELDVAKAGFYWHFKDRNDLLNQVLDYWAHEYTEVITENTQLLSLEPRERLLAAMQMVYDHKLASLDLHFHVWALKDARVAKRVRAVTRRRLDYIGSIFLELGFNAEQAAVRARLFVAHETSELPLFPRQSKERANKQRKLRWKLYLAE